MQTTVELHYSSEARKGGWRIGKYNFQVLVKGDLVVREMQICTDDRSDKWEGTLSLNRREEGFRAGYSALAAQ